MRILHFSENGTHIGGVEGYIADVARALQIAGHESALAYFAPSEPGDLIPGATQFLAAASSNDLYDQINHVLREFQPDVAFLHAVYQPGIVRWIAGQMPVLAYVHGPYLVCPGSGQYLRRSAQVCPRRAGPGCLINAQTQHCCFGRNPFRHLKKLQNVYEFIDTYSALPVLVGSEFMRDLLVRNGVPAETIAMLSPILLPDLLPEPWFQPDSRKILFAGRLVVEKGLGYVIEALSHVIGDWELLVAGDGPDRQVFMDSVTYWKQNDKVRFLGWQDEIELASLYSQSAFVVVPSLLPESFGRVGPEAARYGRPAIAFAAGGVSAWLDDGVTGYLVPPADITALASNLQKLLDNPMECRQLGQQAYSMAVSRWGERTHVQQLMRHFAAAIARWSKQVE